jgi:hypothetical protein
MALSKLGQHIRRFHALHAEHKEREKELDALKAYFREKAGEADHVFELGELQVPVTWKERSSWDSDLLTSEFGAQAAAFKKTSRYAEVSCRRKEAA